MIERNPRDNWWKQIKIRERKQVEVIVNNERSK